MSDSGPKRWDTQRDRAGGDGAHESGDGQEALDRPEEKERIDMVKFAFAPMLGEERVGGVDCPTRSAFLDKREKLLKLQNQENWEQVRDLPSEEIEAEKSRT